MNERILVIRLGALGDLVLCFKAFQAIRNAHPNADIALLTMPAFSKFAQDMPWFDRVLIDSRAPSWRWDEWWRLRKQIKVFEPTRVYDLQGKFRQTVLYKLIGGKKAVEWSGAASGCSHPRLWPPLPKMHFTDFIAAQFERAGLGNAIADAQPDLTWLDAPLDNFNLPKRFALLISGCAANRLYKRWPSSHYAELAKRFKEIGIASVAIGTAADALAIKEITAITNHVIDLSAKTSLQQVAALARRAECVIGNDTGPTHLAAAVGARTLALMSDRVNTIWSAPKGKQTIWLQGTPLSELEVDTVTDTLDTMFDPEPT